MFCSLLKSSPSKLAISLSLTVVSLSSMAQPQSDGTLSSAQSLSPDIMVVFDGSGSMWGQIDGVAKVEIARKALIESLVTANNSSRIGLIAYGHRHKGRCDDIETLVEVSNANSAATKIKNAVEAINPKGKTPLSRAVTLAASKLKYTENAATVVLITDGLETCNADPCALARSLEQDGIDFTAHVVGFGLTDKESKQVACLANETGGMYLDAQNAESLKDALQTTIATSAIPELKEPRPVAVKPKLVHANAGKDWGFGGSRQNYARVDYYTITRDSETGDAVIDPRPILRDYGELVPGEYRIHAKLGQAIVEQDIVVNEGENFTDEINFNAALVSVNILNADGSPAEGRFYVRFCSAEPRSKSGPYQGCRQKTLSKYKIHVNTGEQLRLAVNRDRAWNKVNATKLVTVDPKHTGGETTIDITIGELAYGSAEKEFAIADKE